jgi:probable F420-dependent oxidoreductase
VRIVVQHAVGDPGWRQEILLPPAVATFARVAEQCGYSGIAFTDHPAPTVRWTQAGGEGSADPLVSLAYCAAVTHAIELMTFVLVLPYRNPFLLAHQVNTLDALSGGRLTLGLGTGYLKGEMRALGASPDSRLAQFDETLDTLVRAWTDSSLSEEGTRWSARGVHVQPQVTQRPHPPLWFHGNAAFGRAHAARRGVGWIGVLTGERMAATMRTAPLPDRAAVVAAISDLRRRTTAAGRDPGEIAIGLAGLWPLLDVRQGWDAGAMAGTAHSMAEIGVGTLFVTVCGDDPSAANDTLVAFGEQVVAVVKEERADPAGSAPTGPEQYRVST